jgi:hypothetical protein
VNRNDAYPPFGCCLCDKSGPSCRKRSLRSPGDHVDRAGGGPRLATRAFDFTPDGDRAVEFVLAVAAGESDELDTVAVTLRQWSRSGG